jgi:predicted transposase/invertase (TIGR01784 family)
MTRYIDPKTDFGFKRLFGQEDSKDILKQFLFDVLALPYPIQDLSYIPNEQLPTVPGERVGVYDVYCVDALGRRFIVEMQRGWQLHIKDRVLYYCVFPILHQGRKGGQWGFELVPIYCIAIINFALENDETDLSYLRRVQLMDTDSKEVFYDKLTFVYVELPKFHLTPEQLTSEADKWIYLLKYMPELQDIPAELTTEQFAHAFEIARETALSEEERWQYEMSLKKERDTYATVESARIKGLEEGRAEGIQQGIEQGIQQGIEQGIQQGIEQGIQQGIEQGLEQGRRGAVLATAQSMLARGLAISLIAEVTGLTEAEIVALQEKPNP